MNILVKFLTVIGTIVSLIVICAILLPVWPVTTIGKLILHYLEKAVDVLARSSVSRI